MNFSITRAFSQRSLKSHSWLGLLSAVLLYWICLSGTLAVFSQELTRWEQPTIEETLEYDAAALQRAYEQVLAEQDQFQGLTTMRLPTVDIPRLYINANGQSWYINEDGTLGPPKQHPFTNMIAELHAELHLPHSFGMIVVSVFGALLTALILTGVFAHRRMFKDAFRWRRGGNGQQGEADLHNRLSVWGLPFHLMIALTGAYFGLALLMTNFYAETQYKGDEMALFADVFGATPEVESYNGEMDLPRALTELKRVAPEAQPLFITFERPGEADQYLLMGAQHHDKLIYSEQYRFDAMGNYIDAVGYADGKAGQEAIFSVYRLHFGHFAGEWMKIVYGVLGLALTVICVSGVNIWLKKRQHQDALNDYWAAIVWGTPMAMTLAALVSLLIGFSATITFWVALLLTLIYGGWRKQPQRVTQQLVTASAIGLVALVVSHIVTFGVNLSQPAAVWINGGLLLSALLLFARLRRIKS